MSLILATIGLGVISAEPMTWEDFDHTHARLTRVLKKHVSKGKVDYTALRKDRKVLDSYLKGLEGVSKKDFQDWSDSQKIAFWINAYNAYTLKLIIDNDPVKSIKDLGGWFTSVFGIDFIPLNNLFGEVVDLNRIEHGTLRKNFNEPRIHFALVCASISCPALRSEAYIAKDLDKQLDKQARIFLTDVEKNRYDRKSNTLYLSKIFSWFNNDFRKASRTIRKYVAQYLKFPSDVRVEYLDYDWSLNGK